MEYIVEKEQKVHKLSASEKDEIAQKIVSNFETYDRARADQKDKAHKLIAEIFFQKKLVSDKDPKKAWKSIAKMYKIFMYSQILKAFIWKNTYANNNSMFDVSGENLEADNDSNKEKTMLCDCMDKMEYSKALDKIIDFSLPWGELISFSTWRKKSEEYRRPISFFEGVREPANVPKMLAEKLKGKKFYVDERIIYDNPYVYDVDPENFVFDASQYDDFDACPKIYKTWKTADYIISNKHFNVSKEVAEILKDLAKQEDESDFANQQQSEQKNKQTNGSTIEMLEHWGDLLLPNGTVLKNWYAVVVAGKYLVRFEKNPLVINPFTHGAYVLDPKTKRGISPLYGIYELAQTQEDMLRRTMDLQALTENPPIFSAKGFFKKDAKDVELYPGKIIEYDPQLYSNIPIKPMEFNTAVFQNDLQYIDDLMSEISGIFPNMAGASESDRTTATEISTKVEGQLTRLKMVLDIINNYLILPSIKKIAKLKANFTFGEEEVFVNNDNKQESVIINDKIRQAEYRFTYADRSATSERFNFADLVAQATQMFAKSGLRVNIEEFFTWYMEQKGVENPERFLLTALIPPEVQEILMQNPLVAQIVQQIQAGIQIPSSSQNSQPEGSDMPQIEQPIDTGLVNPSDNLQGRNLLNG
jgi:hypothetical protein